MSLLEILRDNPAIVDAVAQSLGLGSRDARSGIEALVPGIARGFERNLQQPGGLESLLGALKEGGHARYVDDPSVLGEAATGADGNAILGHIFGSKDVSRNLAARASDETSLDSGVLKKMLPVLATVAMGVLSKQTSTGGAAQRLGTADVLTSLLGGGAEVTSTLDDILDLAKRFL